MEEKCSREVSCVLASARQKSSKPFRRFTIPRTKYISKAAERGERRKEEGETKMKGEREREREGERGERERVARSVGRYETVIILKTIIRGTGVPRYTRGVP